MVVERKDELYIARCIELAEESLKNGDHPFGSLVVCDGEIISEASNKTVSENDITNHAEIIAIKKAIKKLNTTDLSNCSLYSIVEPCPMCSFMIREVKFKELVFSLKSPHMGGFSRWDIIQDKGLENFKPVFSKAPLVVLGVLEEEAKQVFEAAGWGMHKK